MDSSLPSPRTRINPFRHAPGYLRPRSDFGQLDRLWSIWRPFGLVRPGVGLLGSLYATYVVLVFAGVAEPDWVIGWILFFPFLILFYLMTIAHLYKGFYHDPNLATIVVLRGGFSGVRRNTGESGHHVGAMSRAAYSFPVERTTIVQVQEKNRTEVLLQVPEDGLYRLHRGSGARAEKVCEAFGSVGVTRTNGTWGPRGILVLDPTFPT